MAIKKLRKRTPAGFNKSVNNNQQKKGINY